LLVRSLLVLLHRGADSPQLTGEYERGFPDEPADFMLRYTIVRVWQVPAQQWLTGGLGLVPLAPLGDVGLDDLPAVLSHVKQRLERELAPREAADLWSAMYILMGLRYERALIQQLVQGVRGMKESVTYQAILEEGEAKGRAKGLVQGKAEEARRMLVLFAREKLGQPSAKVKTALDAVADVSHLEELAQQVSHVTTWEELLGVPAPRRRSARRKPPA
jgi:predicted transposase YdaD